MVSALTGPYGSPPGGFVEPDPFWYRQYKFGEQHYGKQPSTAGNSNTTGSNNSRNSLANEGSDRQAGSSNSARTERNSLDSTEPKPFNWNGSEGKAKKKGKMPDIDLGELADLIDYAQVIAKHEQPVRII